MRIIAGTAKGRALKGPRGSDLRPTADRVRESIFNVLGQWLDGLRVLDLFAGTGALGLEAVSRGAQEAVLVDSGREALELCRHNAQVLGMAAQVRVWPGKVDGRTLAALPGPFDLVFADPPYADFDPARLLALLAAAPQLVAPGGRVVLEHEKRVEAPQVFAKFQRIDARRFGDTAVSLYARASDS